jgi:hypothetical protein
MNVHETRRTLLEHSDCSCPLTLTLSPGGGEGKIHWGPATP